MADPGGQQLVGAEPEHVAHRRVDIVPVAAGGQDGVIGAAAAQRAVGQFGGEGGVTAGEAALGEQGREQQVGVGVPVRDRAQHVVGGAPGRVGARAAGPGAVRGAGPGLVPARLAGPAGGAARRGVCAGISAEPHGTAGAQAAGPLRGGHAALARGLDVAEADRAGAGADEHRLAAGLQLAGPEVLIAES